MTKTKLYTTSEVAEILGLSIRRVQALVSDRKLGQRYGKTILLTQKEIENLKIRVAGRPK